MAPSSRGSASFSEYPDVNRFIDCFTSDVVSVLDRNVLGVYLTGSLSYDAFNYNSSDIDVTVIVHHPVAAAELASIARLHTEIEGKFAKWARRFECSYTPVEMLPNLMPPGQPRPWYWGGDSTLYAEAPFGNEWIINNYHLRSSITLFGPGFEELTEPIDIEEVRKACVRDLFEEWAPKKTTPEWFRDSHYESYFVLNLCRIYHTVICSVAGSKKMAAEWVKANCDERWVSLVSAAQAWEYGVELDLRQEALDFLEFVISQVEDCDFATS